MKTTTLIEEIMKTEDGRRALAIERFVLDATELVCAGLAIRGMSHKKFAKKLRVSKKELKKWLSGEKSLSISRFAEMMFLLDRQVVLGLGPIPEPEPEPEAKPSSMPVSASRDGEEAWMRAVDKGVDESGI